MMGCVPSCTRLYFSAFRLHGLLSQHVVVGQLTGDAVAVLIEHDEVVALDDVRDQVLALAHGDARGGGVPLELPAGLESAVLLVLIDLRQAVGAIGTQLEGCLDAATVGAGDDAGLDARLVEGCGFRLGLSHGDRAIGRRLGVVVHFSGRIA